MLSRSTQDLGLETVLASISSKCLSSSGRKAVLNATPLFDKDLYEKRRKLVSLTADCLVRASGSQSALPCFPEIDDLFEASEAKLTGRFDGGRIFGVALYVESACALHKLMNTIPDTELASVLRNVDKELIELKNEINSILESPGTVRESYPTVKVLIEKERSLRLDRNDYVRNLVSENRMFLNSDEAVLKNGRIAIPVRKEDSGRIKGYVQGISNSGSTYYMEPFGLVDRNNAVDVALREIEAEKERLLGVLSERIKQNLCLLRTLDSQVSQADFLYSFASWILENNWCRVSSDEKYVFRLIQARHPLVGRDCVPVDIAAETGVKAFVLSGPNAGGKTVTMKTVGLFSLLNQICGHIPAAEGSAVRLFDNVFTDIGDEQSIEKSISTFSGHLKNIGCILENITSDSLVVLDELGSGTDPQEGAALARAILEFCADRAAFVFVTSHHGELKKYACSSPSIRNISMEFDSHSLVPTFRVLNGVPGDSHALDAARRFNLPAAVVEAAEKYLGSEALKVNSLLRELEKERQEQKTDREKLERERGELEERQRKLAAAEKSLKERQLAEFDSFAGEARRKLENLVRELREGELNKEKTKKVRSFTQELENVSEELKEEIKHISAGQDGCGSADRLYEPGAAVLCGKYRRQGVVIRREKNGKYLVSVGHIRCLFSGSELVPGEKESLTDNLSGTTPVFPEKIPKPAAQLDLRGFRLEEALKCLEKQIEACCICGFRDFSIIHGYGDGILSRGIHAFLKGEKSVESFAFALPEDGGQGKTYVRLHC